MNTITTHLDLDLSSSNKYKSINVQPNDNNSRVMEIGLYHDGKRYNLSNTYTVRVVGRRSDGASIIKYNIAAIKDNKVSFNLTNDMIAKKGLCQLKLMIYDGEDLLSSFPFSIYVDEDIYDPEGAYADPNVDILQDYVDELSALDNEIKASETLRNSNESKRESAESIRISNENARKSAEARRISEETKRANAENARVTQEDERESNESTRETNENTRRTNESNRIKSETTRNTAESSRITEENARKANEDIRKENETSRVKAEKSRSDAETKRVSSETARVNAEKLRASAEAERISEFTALKSQSESATSGANNVNVKSTSGTDSYVVTVTDRTGTSTNSPNLINKIGIGTVETGNYDEQATANITGAWGNQKLNLRLPVGQPFKIEKSYSSVSAMNADYSTTTVKLYQFVIIDTGNVEDEDNAKLYMKGNTAWTFITDLSGSQGIQGVQGIQGIQGKGLEFAWNGTQLGIRVEGDTSYSYADLKGDKGNTGDTGKSLEFTWNGTKLGVRVEGTTAYTYTDLKGQIGNTPNLTIGTITTSAEGTSASATITGTAENPVLNLTIPRGATSTYGVATSSALGLVKSGTDITVDSSGNVSVNDDSHNHVISNIDGLQTALNGKAPSSHNHSAATASASGFMSSADKTKLDGIATGANKTTVDSALSSTSTNPVQNKVVNTNLGNKMNKANPSGTGSLVMNGTGTGTNEVCLGNSTNQSNGFCMAVVGGSSNVASGNSAAIVGGQKNVMQNDCIGSVVVAANSANLNAANYALVSGYNVIGKSYQVDIGHYNNADISGNGNYSGTGSSTLLCIGNGTSSARSNAFRVNANGATIAKSAYSTSGADYAEFFEWADRNPENEDRRGLFVTIDGDKIKKASADDYILGIVSAMPSVIGNYDEEWMGHYLVDDFNAFIEETFEDEYTFIDEETQEEKTAKTQAVRWKENPDYNPELEYIPREKRQEWSPVGMLGTLNVRDDGSCQVNGFCRVIDGGIATSATTGYRVIKRVTDNIVKVILK